MTLTTLAVAACVSLCAAPVEGAPQARGKLPQHAQPLSQPPLAGPIVLTRFGSGAPGFEFEFPPGSKLVSEDPSIARAVSERTKGVAYVVGIADGTTGVVLTKPSGARVAWVVTVKPLGAHEFVTRVDRLLPDVEGLEFEFWSTPGCFNLACPTCSASELERVGAVERDYLCVLSGPTFGARRRDRRDVSWVMQGVRALLGEGADETPAVVLDIERKRVVLRGEALTVRDVERLERVREQFPEVRFEVDGFPLPQ